MTSFVLAVDGGGSKTDVAAIALDGTLLASARGASSSPQLIGLASAVAVVDALVTDVLSRTPGELAHVAVYLSGLDLPAEIEAFRDAVSPLPWSGRAVIDNDLFALLRAGTSDHDAVAVVCGTGINAVGVRSDGATARFPALGAISGDWGGGWQLGEQALWSAARGNDGRGPHTSLEQLIPPVFGLDSLSGVIEGLHFGRIDDRELNRLSAVLLAAASAGDAVAASVVHRQADEIVLLAAVALERLGLQDRAVPVVLGGGVLASGNELLLGAVAAGIAARAPLAHLEIVTAPPIVGAGLLALEAVGATAGALAAARDSLSEVAA